MGQINTRREMAFRTYEITRKTSRFVYFSAVCLYIIFAYNFLLLFTGHESMHAEMILILFATLVISQIALVKWKQIYPSSYHVSTTGCPKWRWWILKS